MKPAVLLPRLPRRAVAPAIPLDNVMLDLARLGAEDNRRSVAALLILRHLGAR
jgi:hypothetical protein